MALARASFSDKHPTELSTPHLLFRQMQGGDSRKMLMVNAGIIFDPVRIAELYDQHIETSVVAVERDRSPEGRIVGFAMGERNKNHFPSGIGMRVLAVDVQEGTKLPYTQQDCAAGLLKALGRKCLAAGQQKMDVLVFDNDPVILSVLNDKQNPSGAEIITIGRTGPDDDQQKHAFSIFTIPDLTKFCMPSEPDPAARFRLPDSIKLVR